MVPASPPWRSRTATVPDAASFSPTTSMHGTFCSSALRIRAPSFSLRSSSSTRSPAAERRAATARRRLGEPVGDREHDRLHGRDPEREVARRVLDQDAEEPLERAEDRAVQDDRPVRLAVLADVREVEALGLREVALDRAELPGAADRVLDVEVDLRAVEGAVAGRHDVRAAAPSSSAAASARLAAVPLLVGADALLRPQAEARSRRP